MEDDLVRLVRAQRVEQRLLVLQRRLDSLPAELGEHESHVGALEAETEQLDAERKAALTRAQSLETKVQGRDERIARLEQQVRGARDPSSVQVAQHEAQELRDQNARDQDEALAELEAAEELEARRDAARARLEQAREDMDAFRANVERDGASIRAQIEALETERDGHVASCNAMALQQYATLARKYPGRAVAPLRVDSCGGCGTRLVPNEQMRVKAMRSLVRCSSCGRILVPQDLWNAEEERAAGA